MKTAEKIPVVYCGRCLWFVQDWHNTLKRSIGFCRNCYALEGDRVPMRRKTLTRFQFAAWIVDPNRHFCV